MFKKRTNFRKKPQDDEVDEGDAPGILSVEPPRDGKLKGGTSGSSRSKKSDGSSSSKKGGVGGTTAATALLSFEDEEADADVFQVQKKSVKKKSLLRAPDAVRRGSEGVDVETSTKPSGIKGGDYSLESLRELANSQKSFGARPAEHMDPSAPVEIKMRGTLKPPGAELPFAPHMTRDASLEVRKFFSFFLFFSIFLLGFHKKQNKN